MLDSIGFKNNCLNIFRLIAAIQVMYGHAVLHLNLSDVPLLGAFFHSFSGVPIFFTLSGFLIWRSIGRSKSFSHYVKKRFWRIYPELWVAVAVEILVLLALYHHPIDWPNLGLFVIGQASLFQFWTPDFLREYGCGCPNGALWTITVLIQFYFFAFLLYKWLHKKSFYAWMGIIVLLVIVGYLTPNIKSILPEQLSKLYSVTIFPYLWMFVVSAFASEYLDDLLPYLKNYWWVFFVLLLCKIVFVPWDIKLHLYSLIKTILLFCCIIGFSYSYPFFNIKTDISYGVYIYHMTVVNALIEIGLVGKNWVIVLVLVVTCLLALFSTKTIGQLSVNKQ